VSAPGLRPDEVRSFLSGHHGAPVSELEPLHGGYWSSAFGYRLDDRRLVVRFSDTRDGFDADRRAMAHSSVDLPVPEVLSIGAAFGGSFAISVRRDGRFLEEVGAEEAERAGPCLERLLAALRAQPPDEQPSSWRAWLLAGLVDDPAQRVSGWRSSLASDAGLDRLFRATEARVRSLVDDCPERRDLVHGDLLHQNVLVSEDAAEVNAVFSWKCSVRGDFLFDVAWCTFWAPWHPGIEAIDVWMRTMGSPTLSDAELVDAARRHHCYELHIGATHLGWCAWTANDEDLRAVAARTAEVLERGPRQK
jgi:aminoglycoside phosphotransferase (APT) family kinase protein